MNNRISIIIVSYNNPNILLNTIKSIYDHILNMEFEIIIVDNNSSDNNVQLIIKQFPEVKIIENNENYGFGKANNIGAKVAIGDFLLFVNSDIILKGNPINEMLEFYKNENVGLLGGQLLNKDLSIQPSHYNYPTIIKRILELANIKKYLLKFYGTRKHRTEKFYEINIVKGAFFLVDKKFFFDIGMFDESYFMYVEDADLSFQSNKFGRKNYIYNTDKIIHLGWHDESVLNRFVFVNRNKGLIHFYKKNYSIVRAKIFILINVFFFIFKGLFKTFIDKESSKLYKEISILYLKALVI